MCFEVLILNDVIAGECTFLASTICCVVKRKLDTYGVVSARLGLVSVSISICFIGWLRLIDVTAGLVEELLEIAVLRPLKFVILCQYTDINL